MDEQHGERDGLLNVELDNPRCGGYATQVVKREGNQPTLRNRDR